MADNRLVKLTPIRASILELTQSAGAVSASDVAREVISGRNQRTAKAQLVALHKLGLLTPILDALDRICEYRISDAGQAWLDLRARNGAP